MIKNCINSYNEINDCKFFNAYFQMNIPYK